MARPNARDRKPQRPEKRQARRAPTLNEVPAILTSLLVIALLAAAGGAAAWWLSRPEPEQVTAPAEVASPTTRKTPAVPPPSMPFKDVTKEAGIAFVHENGAAGEKLLPETMGGGVGILDYDGDADMDILFVNSKRWDWNSRPGGTPATCALYSNDGKGNFTDVSNETGLDVSLYGMGCAIGDYDDDGDPDVYLSAVGPNRLLRNDGGKFVDVTAQAGVAGPPDAWGTSCGWFDYDLDGRLDLFVCNYIVWSRELDLAQNFRLPDGRPAYGRPQNFVGVHPLLFRNKGNGAFEDVSAAEGLHVPRENAGLPLPKSLGLTFADFGGDGDLDVAVANDTVRNLLFENKSAGEGYEGPAFEEVGIAAGIAFDEKGDARGAMGVDCARFRNGKAVGLCIGNFSNEMTALYVTRPDEMSFTDEAVANGLGAPSRRELTFGVLFTDFDLDGRPDVFAANGHLEPEVNRALPGQRYAQPPHLFWNAGVGQAAEFRPLTRKEAGDEFFEPTVGRGAAFADFDSDGDLDIVMAASGRPARLLRNDLPAGRRWVGLKPVGATVTATAAGESQAKAVMPTRSYLSQSEPILTFGFGTEAADEPIDEIQITWPSGQQQTLKNVDPAHLHVITEP